MPKRLITLLVSLALLATGCAGETGGVSEGQRLYDQNCRQCHGDERGRGGIALAPPHGPQGHTWHHPDQLLEAIVLKGSQQVYGSGAMPAFEGKLTEEDVRAILAYIKTWWKDEQRDLQQSATEEVEQQLRQAR